MRISLATWRGANAKNYGVGRAGRSIKYITVHHVAGNVASLASMYANPAREGSAHFFVSGSVIEQYVDTDNTAWTNNNLTSNRESLTIEVNGNWQPGYHDQATLNKLEVLLRELRRIWPNAQLTFHRDVADKYTFCPGGLKDSGYAVAVWNKAGTTNNPQPAQGGEPKMTAAEEQNAYQIVLGRPMEHGGSGRTGYQFIVGAKPEIEAKRNAAVQEVSAANQRAADAQEALRMAKESHAKQAEQWDSEKKIYAKEIQVLQEQLKDVPLPEEQNELPIEEPKIDQIAAPKRKSFLLRLLQILFPKFRVK